MNEPINPYFGLTFRTWNMSPEIVFEKRKVAINGDTKESMPRDDVDWSFRRDGVQTGGAYSGKLAGEILIPP
jgi:hypothetical protein